VGCRICTSPVKLPLHWLAATRQFATTVTCNRDVPQSLKPGGITVKPMIPGELLVVRNAIAPVLALQLKVSVELPDPSGAAKEMVRGFVVHVTFGVVIVEEGRITAVYATPSAEATARPTRMCGR
jgi:hypothetical protein